MLKRVFTLLLIGLLLGACFYDSPSVAPLPDLTGEWRGVVQDSVSGGGTLTLNLEPTNDEMYSYDASDGSWTLGLSGVNRSGNVAYFYGAEAGLEMRLDALDFSCFYDLEASVAADTMTGTYITTLCAPYALGTFELEKQP